MNTETTTLIVAVVALIVAGYAVYKMGRLPTVAELTPLVEKAVPVGQDFAAVAQIVVNEAEQLKRTGKLDSNDAAFAYALKKAKEYFPVLEPLEQDKLISAINASVLVASALTAQIESAKKNLPTTGMPRSSVTN